MTRSETVRWAGSIGIFYVLIPTFVIISDGLYARALPFVRRPEFSAWMVGVFIAAGLIGATLIILSIRDQIRLGHGHPFDLTGRERLSRPTQVLLTRGVYYWTRNPMGLGDILLYSCLAGVTQSSYSLMINIPLYTLLVCWNHRNNERPALLTRLGAAFDAYERSTSYLVPGPRTWRKLIRGRKKTPKSSGSRVD